MSESRDLSFLKMVDQERNVDPHRHLSKDNHPPNRHLSPFDKFQLPVKQSQDSGQSSLNRLGHFPIIVLTSVFILGIFVILGILGLILLKRRESNKSTLNLHSHATLEAEINSILLESSPGLPQMIPSKERMQDEMRDSLESTRSQIPVPYILPPSLEMDHNFISFDKKLSKVLSATTIESQESLGRFYRS
jgi:hypothetical protein